MVAGAAARAAPNDGPAAAPDPPAAQAAHLCCRPCRRQLCGCQATLQRLCLLPRSCQRALVLLRCRLQVRNLRSLLRCQLR